jgi:hypothetical protein
MLVYSPYSLGKLIDWKPRKENIPQNPESGGTPYSLGKLIDWKLKFNLLGDDFLNHSDSLLAREIN